jgi:hypothetical protein
LPRPLAPVVSRAASGQPPLLSGSMPACDVRGRSLLTLVVPAGLPPVPSRPQRPSAVLVIFCSNMYEKPTLPVMNRPPGSYGFVPRPSPANVPGYSTRTGRAWASHPLHTTDSQNQTRLCPRRPAGMDASSYASPFFPFFFFFFLFFFLAGRKAPSSSVSSASSSSL